MPNKKMPKKLLKTIEVDVHSNGGFTVWIKERSNGRITKHWLLDASCFPDDGQVRLGNQDCWNYNAVMNPTENTIDFVIKK